MDSQQIQNEIKELIQVRNKFLQCARIRRTLVTRKLKLFEDFNSLPASNKIDSLPEFLKKYEALYKRELRITDLFKKGLKNGIKALEKVLPQSGSEKKYVSDALQMCKQIEEIIANYEKRMIKEEYLFKSSEHEAKLTLIKELHDELRIEVVDDLNFIRNAQEIMPKLASLQKEINAKIAKTETTSVLLTRTFGGALTLFGVIDIGTAGVTAIISAITKLPIPTLLLLLSGIAGSIAGISLMALSANLTGEKLKELATSAELEKLGKLLPK